MPISDWSALMPDLVEVRPRTGHDAWGAPLFGDGVVLRGRVRREAHLLRGADGEERTARGTVWLAAAAGVAAGDRLVFADGSDGMVLAADPAADHAGPHHLRLHFG